MQTFIKVYFYECKLLFYDQREDKRCPFDLLAICLKYQANWGRDMQRIIEPVRMWPWRAVAGASEFFSRMNWGVLLPLVFWHSFFFFLLLLLLFPPSGDSFQKKTKEGECIEKEGEREMVVPLGQIWKDFTACLQVQGNASKGLALGNEWIEYPANEILVGFWKD